MVSPRCLSCPGELVIERLVPVVEEEEQEDVREEEEERPSFNLSSPASLLQEVL